jgi:hypothetical protein
MKKIRNFFSLPNVLFGLSIGIFFLFAEESKLVASSEAKLILAMLGVVAIIALRNVTEIYYISRTQQDLPKIRQRGIYYVSMSMGKNAGDYLTDDPDKCVYRRVAQVARVIRFDNQGKVILGKWKWYQIAIQGPIDTGLYVTTDQTYTFYRPDGTSYELKKYIPDRKDVAA